MALIKDMLKGNLATTLAAAVGAGILELTVIQSAGALCGRLPKQRCISPTPFSTMRIAVPRHPA